MLHCSTPGTLIQFSPDLGNGVCANAVHPKQPNLWVVCRYAEKFVYPWRECPDLDIPPNRANGAVPVITGALRL